MCPLLHDENVIIVKSWIIMYHVDFYGLEQKIVVKKAKTFFWKLAVTEKKPLRLKSYQSNKSNQKDLVKFLQEECPIFLMRD